MSGEPVRRERKRCNEKELQESVQSVVSDAARGERELLPGTVLE